VDGRKRVLDFELGASESLATAQALVGRLIQRGFRAAADRPPGWLVEAESPGQTDAQESAPAGSLIDTADKVTVGSRG